MRRAGQSRSCQLLNDRLPFHRRSKWAWTGPISGCPVTWELTGTHSIPACGTLADQRRISTFLNQILASDGSRFRLPRPAIFDDLRSHCSVLLSPIQPLLPVEGKPAFQISLRSRVARMSSVRLPLPRTRSARNPGAILPRSERRKAVALADVTVTNGL
jgi:hypothetical protein